MFSFLFQIPTSAQYLMGIVIIIVRTQLEVMFAAVDRATFLLLMEEAVKV